MSRIPFITRHEDLPAERQSFIDRIIRTRGRVAGPYKVLLNSPEIADRVATVGEFLLYDTVVPPAAKTLTWLITAREYDCEYEWAVSVPHAQKAGVPDTLVNAIWNRTPLKDLTPGQELLVDFCHQMLRGNHHVSETTYNATVAHFGVAATVQIATTIGYFTMQAFVLNAFEVDPKDEAGEPLL